MISHVTPVSPQEGTIVTMPRAKRTRERLPPSFDLILLGTVPRRSLELAHNGAANDANSP